MLVTDWNFSEEVKTSFIEAARDGNNGILIFVLQMYSPALTMRCNEAMKKWKELRKNIKIYKLMLNTLLY